MKKRIVIVGSGFGGLEVALSLKNLCREEAEITVIDRSPVQAYLPSIHEVISGKVRPGEIEIPLAPIFESAGIAFIEDEVGALEPQARQVMTKAGPQTYDYLVLAVGARINFYNIPGASEYAHAFRNPAQADRIGREVRRILAHEKGASPIMIAGGGFEGVEIAGELLDMIDEAGRLDDLTSGRFTIEVIESADRLLHDCSKRAQDFVEAYLGDKGIKIETGRKISRVEKDRIILDSGEARSMSMLIWTGGIQPLPWIQASNLEKDNQGWIKVTRALHAPQDDRIYSLGDTVTIVTEEGPLPLPRVASHTLDQAAVVALNLYYDLKKLRKINYYPKVKPQLISLGRDMGIVTEKDLFIASSWAARLKKAVEKSHMMTYRSKPYMAALSAKLPGSELRHLFRILKPV
ncbi:MAG: FAD-dependent oxidoreductase [bacterium]|nr:FAD-dependent oxidoreductase [bacterium]